MERGMEQAKIWQVPDFEAMEQTEQAERGSRAHGRAEKFSPHPVKTIFARVVYPLFHLFRLFYLRENKRIYAVCLFHTLFHARSIVLFPGSQKGASA